MRYRILGELEVVVGGEPLHVGGRRQRLVLAVLLDHADRRISVDRLIDAVWGGRPPSTARKTVQAYISRLRALLGDGVIETTVDGYVLVPDGGLDARRFEELARQGHALLATDPATAARVLRDALALWRGAPYGSLGDEPALAVTRGRFLERRLDVLEHRIEADLELGNDTGLVAELEGLVVDHPSREHLHGLLMLALYRRGRQAEALDVARRLRERLAEELGLEPSPRIADLQERILAHDPSLMRTRPDPAGDPVGLPVDVGDTAGADPLVGAPADAGRDGPGERHTAEPGRRPANPYRGLRPFTEGDAPRFFGRGSLVEELLGRVAASSLVVVVGPSGSGKSSVVRAGLLPAVRTRHPDWTIATMLPGRHPFAELVAALAAAAPDAVVDDRTLAGDDLDVLRLVLRSTGEDGHLLLVVDQLEELFLLTGPDERERFARGLVEAIEDPHGRLTAVATVRADFLDQPLQHASLGRHVDASTVLVPPLSPSELERACVEPARAVGVDVAPELVTKLVDDVAAEPGALPLFQYALTELFEARDAGALTLGGYRRLGGLTGALASRGDALLATLPGEVRAVARQVLLRLVTLGEGAADTRRRVDRAELEGLGGPPGAVGRVLEVFGDARLLSFDRDATTGKPTVEVAHEALLRSWPTLAAWVDEARDDLRVHRLLSLAHEEWEQAAHHDDFLLRGTRLASFEDWLDGTTVALTAGEEEFLGTSRRRADEQRIADEARREHERQLEGRANRRLRQLVAVFAVAALVAGGVGVVAVDQANRLEDARDEAIVEGELARARELAASAVANRLIDPGLSLLLALHAVRITHDAGEPLEPDTVAALHWVLQAGRVGYPDGWPSRVVAGPDGARGIFLLDVPDLVTHARQAVDRDLTPAECVRHLGTGDCPDPLPTTLGPDVEGTQPAAAVVEDDGALAGTSVRMFGGMREGDPETEALIEFVRSHTDGVELVVDSEANVEIVLDDRARLDDFDLAVLAQPSRVVEESGRSGLGLQAIGSWFPTEDSAPHLLSLARVGEAGEWPSADGAVRAFPVETQLKGLVWYSRDVFEDAGYEIPTTLDELEALTARMVDDGRTPWCLGIESGEFSGWPATDIVEALVLGDLGPAAYDRWVKGELPFTHRGVRRAVETYVELFLAPDRVLGGVPGVLESAWVSPRFGIPEGACVMGVGISFQAGFLHDVADYFPIPPRSPAGDGARLGAGLYVMALSDRPEVRAVVDALFDDGAVAARNAAGQLWYLSPNERYEPTELPVDDPRRQVAAELSEALRADLFRYDGSDLMPQPVWEAFNAGMVEITRDPTSIDRVLAGIDAAWPVDG